VQLVVIKFKKKSTNFVFETHTNSTDPLTIFKQKNKQLKILINILTNTKLQWDIALYGIKYPAEEVKKYS